MTETLEQQLRCRVEACYQQAEKQLGRSFERPTISLKQRGKIAGTAHLQLNELRFQPKILAQNSEHFLHHVVPHEISHLLAWQLYGNVRPHGREWQQLMVDVFDVPPHRTHSYDTSNIGIKHYPYQCGCGPVMLTARRHANAQNGMQYRCRRCQQSLLSTERSAESSAENSAQSDLSIPSTPRPSPSPSPKKRSFDYQCHCGPVQLSVIRHNKVLRGTSYQCRRCKQILKATG